MEEFITTWPVWETLTIMEQRNVDAFMTKAVGRYPPTYVPYIDLSRFSMTFNGDEVTNISFGRYNFTKHDKVLVSDDDTLQIVQRNFGPIGERYAPGQRPTYRYGEISGRDRGTLLGWIITSPTMKQIIDLYNEVGDILMDIIEFNTFPIDELGKTLFKILKIRDIVYPYGKQAELEVVYGPADLINELRTLKKTNDQAGLIQLAIKAVDYYTFDPHIITAKGVYFKGSDLFTIEDNRQNNLKDSDIIRTNPYKCMVDIARNIAFLHQLNAVHGDISVKEFCIRNEEIYLISGLDFPTHNTSVGKYEYLLPESKQRLTFTERGDILLLGLTLIEILNPDLIADWIANNKDDSYRNFTVDDPQLQIIIDQCLKPDPTITVAEIVIQLSNLL